MTAVVVALVKLIPHAEPWWLTMFVVVAAGLALPTRIAGVVMVVATSAAVVAGRLIAGYFDRFADADRVRRRRRGHPAADDQRRATPGCPRGSGAGGGRSGAVTLRARSPRRSGPHALGHRPQERAGRPSLPHRHCRPPKRSATSSDRRARRCVRFATRWLVTASPSSRVS